MDPSAQNGGSPLNLCLESQLSFHVLSTSLRIQAPSLKKTAVWPLWMSLSLGRVLIRDLIPKKPALLLSLPIRSLAHWFSNKHIQGKNIVSLTGRVIWSCPSRTVGLPPPDLAQGHTRALASLTGGSTIGPLSAQSPTSSFFPSQSEGNPTKAWFPFSAMVLGGNPV